MTNSPRSKIIIGLFLIIACFVVGYFFTTPAWHKYSLTKRILAQTQSDSVGLAQALSTMKDFVAQFTTHQSDADKVSRALPSQVPDLTNLLGNLSSEAEASGLALSSFSIQADTDSKPKLPNTIQTIKVDIAASGSYESFRDFLMRLEASLRITDIDRVTVKANDTSQPQYQMSIRTYYQK